MLTLCNDYRRPRISPRGMSLLTMSCVTRRNSFLYWETIGAAS